MRIKMSDVCQRRLEDSLCKVLHYQRVIRNKMYLSISLSCSTKTLQTESCRRPVNFGNEF